MAVEYLRIPGIAGDHDVRTISVALGALPGVLLVTVSLVDRDVRVEHTGRTSLEELIRALSAAGYSQVSVLAKIMALHMARLRADCERLLDLADHHRAER
jgi:copper chaperone CopZ